MSVREPARTGVAGMIPRPGWACRRQAGSLTRVFARLAIQDRAGERSHNCGPARTQGVG